MLPREAILIAWTGQKNEEKKDGAGVQAPDPTKALVTKYGIFLTGGRADQHIKESERPDEKSGYFKDEGYSKDDPLSKETRLAHAQALWQGFQNNTEHTQLVYALDQGLTGATMVSNGANSYFLLDYNVDGSEDGVKYTYKYVGDNFGKPGGKEDRPEVCRRFLDLRPGREPGRGRGREMVHQGPQ